MTKKSALLLLLLLLLFLLALTLSGCSSTTEEHIRASAEEITFNRIVGRRAASGGFVLTKDSLSMRPSE